MRKKKKRVKHHLESIDVFECKSMRSRGDAGPRLNLIKPSGLSISEKREMTACHFTSGSRDVRRCLKEAKGGRYGVRQSKGSGNIIETLRKTAGGNGGGVGVEVCVPACVCACVWFILPTGNIITPYHNPESGGGRGGLAGSKTANT